MWLSSADTKIAELESNPTFVVYPKGFYKNYMEPWTTVYTEVKEVLNEGRQCLEVRINEVFEQCETLGLSPTHRFALALLSIRGYFTTDDVDIDTFKALSPENKDYQQLLEIFHEVLSRSKYTPILQPFQHYYKGICSTIDFKDLDVPEPEEKGKAHLLLASVEPTQLLASLWADEGSPSAFLSLYAVVKIFAYSMWYLKQADPHTTTRPIKALSNIQACNEQSIYLNAFGVPRSLITWTEGWSWILCNVTLQDNTVIQNVEVPLYILVKLGFLQDVLSYIQ